jgi:endonuclease/exonuclease/phosphatase family metal-dependent hydrolase
MALAVETICYGRHRFCRSCTPAIGLAGRGTRGAHRSALFSADRTLEALISYRAPVASPGASDQGVSSAAGRALRIMTYNVHGCVGSDLRFEPERIARTIEAASPDVVALQEIYVEHPQRRHLDQAAWLAERLEMRYEFGSARDCEDGCRYGNAVLSKLPMRQLRAECLPQLSPKLEPRAALRVEVTTGWGGLDLVNTHLGLRPRERVLQTRALAEDWLSHVTPESASVLCGDLNALPGSRVYSMFTRLLQDAELSQRGRRAAKTWPALFPLVRLDHVFVAPGLRVVGWRVPSSFVERLASDHLPVVVDVVAKDGAR